VVSGQSVAANLNRYDLLRHNGGQKSSHMLSLFSIIRNGGGFVLAGEVEAHGDRSASTDHGQSA